MILRKIGGLMIIVFIAALLCGQPSTFSHWSTRGIAIRYPFGAIAIYRVDRIEGASGYYIAYMPRPKGK